MTAEPIPRSFRFARHFRWSILGQAASLAVGLLATPLLVRRLGVELYGLYILLQTVSSYLLLLTFGAGAATVKYVAALKASHDGRGLREAVRWAFIFHGPTVLTGVVVLIVTARGVLQRVFHVPASLLDLGAQVIALGAIGAFFFSITQAAICVLQGLQRFAEQSVISFLQGAPLTVGAALLVGFGHGLRSVAVWYAAWNAAIAVFALIWTAWLLRPAAPNSGPGHITGKDFGVWGLSQWVGQLASIVLNQFDRIFAARYTTLAGLTLYSVPAGLLQRLQIVPGTAAMVLTPMLSELRGEEHRPAVRSLYLRGTRLLFGLMLPIWTLMFCLMPQFLSLWLGGEFGDRAVWPVRLLIIAQTINLLIAMPNISAYVLGRAWHMPLLGWAQAVTSSVAWLILAKPYGLIGIAWGAVLAQALPALFYIPLIQWRVVDVSLRTLVRKGLFAPMAAAAVLFGAVFPVHAWAGSWARLFLVGAAGTLLYCAALWILAPAEDRQSIRHYLHWETARRRA